MKIFAMFTSQLDGIFVESPGPGRRFALGSGPRTSYIDVRESGTYAGTVQVQHDSAGAPFRSVEAFGNWLAIGLSNVVVVVHHRFSDGRIFYVDGYFGSFYPLDDKLMVCSASQVIALNPGGRELWRAEGLGVDGVIIHDHDETSLTGDGEMDPPGGWLPFKLDHRTGHRMA